jgi:mono/diheme cytochrome c family protein
MGCVALAICGCSAWAVLATAPSASTQVAATIPAREARRKNPIPADEGSRATGKQIFAGNCAPCHGVSGKGNGKVAHLQDLPPADLTDAKYGKETDGTLHWRLSNGHPPMPKFENTLPDESRWNVVNYLRTLIAQPASTTAAAPATAPATMKAP